MEQPQKKKRPGLIALAVVLIAALVVGALWLFGVFGARGDSAGEPGGDQSEFAGFAGGVFVGGDDIGRTTILSFAENKLYVCHVSSLVTQGNLADVMDGAYYYSYDYNYADETKTLALSWPNADETYAVEPGDAGSLRLCSNGDAAMIVGLFARLGDAPEAAPSNFADGLLTRAFLKGAWVQQISNIDGFCKYHSFYISSTEFFILPFETTVEHETGYNDELGFRCAVDHDPTINDTYFEFEVLTQERIRVNYAGVSTEEKAPNAEYGILIMGENEVYIRARDADAYKLNGCYNKAAPGKNMTGVWMLPYDAQMGQDGYYHLQFAEVTDTEMFLRDHRAEFPEFDFSSLGQYYCNPSDILAYDYAGLETGRFVVEGNVYCVPVQISDNLFLIGVASEPSGPPIYWTAAYRFPE